MYKLVNGKLVEMTVEEIHEHEERTESDSRKADIAERHRPLTESEVSRMLITQQINTLDVDDQTALRMMEYYPTWVTDTAYSAGYKVQYNGKLHKVITAHNSQADWTPDVAVTLFERIDEEHDGSEYDPIPYDGNMALENGKYYTQDGVVYKCIRDTGNPVYHVLAELVGVYVVEV